MRRRLGTVSERGRDAGAVTILFAVGIAAIIMIIAVSVDVSGSLRASFRARALAEQAARAGAGQINLGKALAGGGSQIDNDVSAVQTAACGPGALPADAKCVGQVVVGSDTVTVTVTLTYHSLLHTMFGFTDHAQTATATALLVSAAPPSP
jgi:Flp pilus assembly protein TadG